MKKAMPRKPPKKSPAKARKSPGPELIRGMKQLRDRIDEFNKENWCGQCGQKLVTGGCGPTHAIKMLEFAKKHLLPTVSPTRDEGRKLEEVRKYCERISANKGSDDYVVGCRGVARGVLAILNSTPTAKGGKK